jgi:hypothetical protein
MLENLCNSLYIWENWQKLGEFSCKTCVQIEHIIQSATKPPKGNKVLYVQREFQEDCRK